MTPYTPEVALFLAKVFTAAVVIFGVYQVSDMIEDWIEYFKE